MQKKRIKRIPLKYYPDSEIMEYVLKELDCEDFRRHCRETAANLGIDAKVVTEVMTDHAYQVIKTVQKEVFLKRRIKINIYGFYFIVLFPPKQNVKFIKRKQNANNISRANDGSRTRNSI